MNSKKFVVQLHCILSTSLEGAIQNSHCSLLMEGSEKIMHVVNIQSRYYADEVQAVAKLILGLADVISLVAEERRKKRKYKRKV